MKYGKLMINTSMNDTAYRCFDYISSEDVVKFVKKFQQQHNDGWQTTHTYRELILGTYLCLKGYHARYAKLDSQEPDWSIFDEDCKIKAIVELTSFHAPRVVETQLLENQQGVWGQHENVGRLYQSIKYKITKYKGLVEKLGLGFIVAVFNQVPAFIQPEEFKECLLDTDAGLFKDYPILSGALLFQEGIGNYDTLPYSFGFWDNPKPQVEFSLS